METTTVPMILEAVKKELGRRGMSIYQLAKAVEKISGKNADPVYKFLSGEREPTTRTLEYICQALELELRPRKN